MKYTYLITVLLVTVIIFTIFTVHRKIEGFDGEENTPSNPLDSVMKLIRRSSSRLLDIDMWKERILMSSMSPMDLARYHLKSHAESEDGQTS